MGDSFHEHEEDHLKFIGETQLSLINLAKELQATLSNATKAIKNVLRQQQSNKSEEEIQEAIRAALIHGDSVEELSSSSWEKIEQSLGVSANQEVRQGLTDILKTLHLARENSKQIFSEYLQRAEDISANLRNDRAQFYQLILHTMELVQLLPEYHPNETRDKENKAALNFDAKIGDKPA